MTQSTKHRAGSRRTKHEAAARRAAVKRNQSNWRPAEVWMTVNEAAAFWGIAPSSVRSRISSGSVTARKEGRNWMVLRPQAA